jgi:hypothetical protein
MRRVGVIKKLNSLERDFVRESSSEAFFTFLGLTTVRKRDLPPEELFRFLESLTKKQISFVAHLLTCGNCQVRAISELSPKSPDRRSSEDLEDATPGPVEDFVVLSSAS